MNESDSSRNNRKDETKKETPSLLSGMKKPPTPKVNNTKKDKHRPFPSSRGPTNGSRAKSPQTLSPVPLASTPPRSDAVNLTQSPVAEDPTSSRGDEGEKTDKLGSGLRQLVWDGLRDLCKDTFSVPPERNGDDLFASFLRHKDLKSTIKTGSNDVDSSNNLRYDFFDVDETTGNIVLQPKIPIFPEDFPQGTREWPLSWWGIVDPSIEEQNIENKEKINIITDTTGDRKSRQDRSDAQSDWKSPERKDEISERNRRGGNRSTRKRSSRDRYDDDHPSREDRFDRSVGGERAGSVYPPPLRGNNYDYDHNDFRNPRHHGGGPPGPRRIGDGPPPHYRPFPRDVPQPGDFRGVPRPYLTKEYQHRDQYGQPWRGLPMPLHGDRREIRDRDHTRRSPYSKPSSEGGPSLGRNPTGSSNRKR